MKELHFAFKTLFKELGLLLTFRVLFMFSLKSAMGHPFKDFEKSDDPKEKQSRDQIGPAILLYQTLLAHNIDKNSSLSLTEKIVVFGTLIFLKKSLGPIKKESIQNMVTEEKEAFAKTKADSFFNATMIWNEISKNKISFTVKKCHFPILCKQAGVPELSPVFCKGDLYYFRDVEKNIHFERPHTLAEGGKDCPFTLKFK